MKLTDKAKADFRKHMKVQGLSLALIPKILNTEIVDWLDSVGIYITVKAYLGGGAVVFYPQLEYLNEDFINIFDCPKWDDDTQWYSTSRQEATEAAICIANEIYNKL